MEVVSIIPARGGSKEIPNKNIILVSGKPLIEWTIEQSLRTESISSTYVSTDDEKIADVAIKKGAKVIHRPKELSQDDSTSESAIVHALGYLNKEINIIPDVVVMLQATSPLRKPNDIENAVKQFIYKKADSLISGSVLEDFLIWECTNDEWKSVNWDYKNRGRRQKRTRQYVENGSIYVFKPDVILKFDNRIGEKLHFYEMEFWQNWEIDSYADLPLVEFYINSKLKFHETTNLRLSVIELIALDFDGVLTDNKVITLEDGTEGINANRADGLAISEFKKINIQCVIISSETNNVVKARANKLNIPYLKGVKDKKIELIKYCNSKNISMKNVIFIGNDINDKEVMNCVGWPLCPKDAHDSIKNISRFVIRVNGGDGVLRYILDILQSNRRP